MRFPEEEYHLPFFDEHGYVRKLCPRCREYFWTMNSSQKLCGESTIEGCGEYTFIGNPPTEKPHTLQEMREVFLSFFEQRGHMRIKPYPIVARWRDDLYFTNASIIDFQPYVTEGMIPPPANPLVISQPCVRFPDVDNVGHTFGRHLTIFEMGGHHAFNYPNKEVYWKDETVRYHHEFVTKELGVKPEHVVYKEGIWVGGGNAGPDVESIIDGLEVGTLVFMKYKVVNGEFLELPIRTVDTGYGIERLTWLSQGALSCFHAVYGDLLNKIMDMAGIEEVDEKILTEISKISGLISISKTSSRDENWRKIAGRIGIPLLSLQPIMNSVVNVFAVTDHTKCLAFMLAEGVVPSNVREGYLTRLMIRRTYRLLKNLSIEDMISEIIDMQISLWSKDFPHLREMRDEILELLSIELEKYEQTIERGRELVKRFIRDMKTEKTAEISIDKLVELYDSHGLPPEVVSETASKEGITVQVPEDFYSFVAERHLEAPKTLKPILTEDVSNLQKYFSGLQETRTLYYEDAYISTFNARVLRVSDNRVALDKTSFYPEGGGQMADNGFLEFSGTRSQVVDVKKAGNVIVHFLKGAVPKEGDEIKGIVDWERRISLMRHHTATHVVMGAARRVLGEHIWQAGAQKEVEQARLDISHPKRLTTEEIIKIENLANEIVMKNIPVESFWMPREEAEKLYGFRLYQGGVVPGREIRVVKTGNWEVEACGGTHCKSTGEIGLIKIVHTERIQDGVERIIFSAGVPAVKRIQDVEAKLRRIAILHEAPIEKVESAVEKVLQEYKKLRREKESLIEQFAKSKAKEYYNRSIPVSEFSFVAQRVNEEEVSKDSLIKVANDLVAQYPSSIAVFVSVGKNDAKLIVRVGDKALKHGVDAREIAREAALELGGGGSGKPGFAQGGGTRIERADKALEKAEAIVRKKLERETHVG
ncbi:MAG: alanine--tRNA ligase [Candidatus Bathyarchaeia archaeon]